MIVCFDETNLSYIHLQTTVIVSSCCLTKLKGINLDNNPLMVYVRTHSSYRSSNLTNRE